MDAVLVVLAAGLARRFGRLKQLDPVGPSGECLLDYGIFDALRAGFRRVVIVIRAGIEAEFRANLDRFFPGLDARTVEQRLETPETAGRKRSRPWGTAHAVLEAAAGIDGPFAIMNADDFYGRRSFELLAGRLRSVDPEGAQGVIVGFALEDTLSEHGGVSRALCVRNPDGTLRRIVEMTNVHRSAGSRIVGTAAGETHVLEAGSLVSMNLWGFTPAVVPVLARGFVRFLAEWAGDDHAEYVLPQVIDDAVEASRMRIDVVASPEAWFGMTFIEDRDRVSSRLRELVAAGEYPSDLRQPAD